ncbi:hypothetical protein [Sphingomonas yantingensis]|uniref:Heme exporter protein D n=1 Tax=Sphingomonas yantingensis TaxID=1241761 RepID=A0A7W9ARN8_9SPHN|nr:hypothetical protein [Sphingomonas yantingensis]MBB5699365.1 hypothetical protein [Sphingomonas yantingensis]
MRSYALFDTTREIVAYGILGAIVVVAIPWLTVTISKRRRENLRRRGIKRYGH